MHRARGSRLVRLLLTVPMAAAGLLVLPMPGPAVAETCSPPEQQLTASVPTDRSGYVTQLAPQSAWALSRGAGQVVALLDTGVSAAAGQVALPGRLRDGGNKASGASSALVDCDGRGTADAGLIAGSDASGRIPGIAPEATVLSIRVQAAADTAPSADTVAGGIDAAVNAKAKIIVVTARTAGSTKLKASVAAAQKAGALIVAAVGDDPSQKTSYPAQYPDVLGVGGESASGSDQMVSGSYIDLVAPSNSLAGVGVSGKGYRLDVGGSAAAAALVAGTVALARSRQPTFTPKQILARMQYAADHPAAKLPSSTLGWGTVNPYATLALPTSITALPSSAPNPRLGSVSLPPPDRPAHRFTAVGITVGLAAAAIAIMAAIAGVRRARRRKWASAD